jgi:ribosomal protein S18 acetylase RimI-like enzyme
MSVFVAVSESGEVVGTVGGGVVDDDEADAGEGHIRGMAVKPEWQGSGVAQQLLEMVEVELGQLKCSRITLDTTMPLERAMRFYERNGYRRSGRISDFFGMPLYEYVKTVVRSQ